jgi:osmoprotectant transport system permease protein
MIHLLSMLSLLVVSFSATLMAKPKIIVGSKIFTESYIVAEILAQTIEDAGEADVERRIGLGATGIVFESLKSGQIDIYPEYTGTIAEIFFKNSKLQDITSINLKLDPMGLKISDSLGFNNTYALAKKANAYETEKITKISDLREFPKTRVGFTHEFLKRNDGFEALTNHYRMKLKNFKGMEHSLIYQSLLENKLDVIEVYSTDAKIQKYNLQILTDDLDFFPKYQGVFFYRKELEDKFPKTMAALKNLEHQITEEKMIALNAKTEIDGWSFDKTASYFLKKDSQKTFFSWDLLWRRTKEHLSLVFISLLAAIIVAVPCGYFASGHPKVGNLLMAFSGILQTIPSLALLCFLIPVFGIGYLPSVVALFLYALLPIVRNTYLGFQGIDTRLIESAQTLGLSRWHRLSKVQIPLASPAILSGIKISAVMNVGGATLAAFVGAGGYGAIIVTGLALNDTSLILLGAVPSALMAIAIHGFFEFLDALVIPKGLRN